MKNLESVIIESIESNDLSNIENELIDMYNKNDICIGELLASIGVNNISLEEAFELYCRIMNKVEDDNFVQFYNGTRDFESDNFKFIGE